MGHRRQLIAMKLPTQGVPRWGTDGHSSHFALRANGRWLPQSYVQFELDCSRFVPIRDEFRPCRFQA